MRMATKSEHEKVDEIVVKFFNDLPTLAKQMETMNGMTSAMLNIRNRFYAAYKVGLSEGLKIRYDMVQMN